MRRAECLIERAVWPTPACCTSFRRVILLTYFSAEHCVAIVEEGRELAGSGASLSFYCDLVVLSMSASWSASRTVGCFYTILFGQRTFGITVQHRRAANSSAVTAPPTFHHRRAVCSSHLLAVTGVFRQSAAPVHESSSAHAAGHDAFPFEWCCGGGVSRLFCDAHSGRPNFIEYFPPFTGSPAGGLKG